MAADKRMDRSMRRRIFWRLFLLQAWWNFERMQSLGLTYCLEPWFKRCGLSGRERRSAMARHAGAYFNTQPYMAAFIAGMVCSLEQDIADASARDKEAKVKRLSALKTAAAGALAGIGDALFWGALRPFCAALGLVIGLLLIRRGMSAFGLGIAAVYLVIFNAPSLWVRYEGIVLGYRWGEQLPFKLKQFPVQAWIQRLRLAGAAMAAAVLVYALWDLAGQRLIGITAFAIYALILEKRPQSWTSLYGATCGLGVLAAVGRS